MTFTTQELFRSHEIRKTKAQKERFRSWIVPILRESGWTVGTEPGSMGSQNIVIGDIEKAEVVFTAHYDTCVVMPVPNFITPKNPVFYLLYQLLIMIPMFAILFGTSWLFSLVHPNLFMVGYWTAFLVMMGLLRYGPANRHTANDNTSGVTAVLDLALSLPEELRERAAFVLFDLEEMGLVGSGSFARKHKKTMEQRLLVNMDCVSDGETMLFVLRKGAVPHLDRLKTAFVSDDRITAEFVTKGYIYPSDQNKFNCGVGVSSMLRSKRGILYMDKIHTAKDTVYREENIAWLVEGCKKLLMKEGERE